MTMTTSVGVVITSYLMISVSPNASHVQFDDMRMSQHFQVLYLSLHSNAIVLLLVDLALVDEFQRDLMTRYSVFGHWFH